MLPGLEIPKWFNHQSVGNSISFWVGRDCDLKFDYCVVLDPNQCNDSVYVSLKLNGINLPELIPLRFTQMKDVMCNHVCLFKVYDIPFPIKKKKVYTSRWSDEHVNLFVRNRVELKFCIYESRIRRCGVRVECICPPVQHLSTDTIPPTSIPTFPICSISNSVTPSPHLLNSCLELSNSNSMETTYTDSDSPSEGSHDDECDLSLSPCTSPMGRNYPPPPPQVTIPDDASHISLPSSIDLPNNMTDMLELCLSVQGLGIGSTVSEGFHLGSSSMAHNYVSDDDSDFNL